MKMVSMKKDEGKMQEKMLEAPEPSPYPYGLRISLDKESMEKLGMKDMPEMGKKIKVEAMVEVCGFSMHESKNHEYKSCDLQITEMGLEGKKSNPAEKLYGKKD